MRKEYVKPGISVELFSLAQSIAAACEGFQHDTGLGEPAHYDKTTCGWAMGDFIVFVDAKICTDAQIGEDEDFNGLCYNNPDGGTTIFGS